MAMIKAGFDFHAREPFGGEPHLFQHRYCCESQSDFKTEIGLEAGCGLRQIQEEQSMKSATSFYSCLAAALLVVLASAGIAATACSGKETCYGTEALNSDQSSTDDNSAFGYGALNHDTTGIQNTATGAGALLANTTGGGNTATGAAALVTNTTGGDNTATGSSTLLNNTTGGENTATGYAALFSNTTVIGNTATGMKALGANTIGDVNTAAGVGALQCNTTGGSNTATGAGALLANTTGSGNTAAGVSALQSNTTGNGNTSDGYKALSSNTTGLENTADGANALSSNTTGKNNTAAGINALGRNTTGGHNTATGDSALSSNTMGDYNIGIGADARYNLTTGFENIDIGNVGVAAESGTIRIGVAGPQTAAYIAGINGSAVAGTADVVVTSAGQLGVMASSARYKRDIHYMGQSSAGLMKLRPVTFRYKNDPEATRQYGLVAEEVERVYPELVVHDADGKILSVRYSTLTSMLLNELQKQTRDNARKAARLNRLAAQIAELKASHERELGTMRTAFEQRLSRIEQTMASKDGNHNLATAFNR